MVGSDFGLFTVSIVYYNILGFCLNQYLATDKVRLYGEPYDENRFPAPRFLFYRNRHILLYACKLYHILCRKTYRVRQIP